MALMRFFRFKQIPLIFIAVLFVLPAMAEISGRRDLHNNVPAAARLNSMGPLRETNHLDLTIGLPFRNREMLTNLLNELYDPTTPRFRQWLTADQFTGQFGPTETDYQKVIVFAKEQGLKITQEYSNRMLLSVRGSTTNIENAFQIKLRTYRHPTTATDVLCTRPGSISRNERPHFVR